ncbi:MAG: DUF2007 domain-containing protein [Verrucomicrobiota bacterium]
MITIATFSKVEEAHLLRMRLGDAGVPAYLRDENTIQWDPWYNIVLGGVRVEVADADVDAAKAVLAAEPEISE